MWIWTRSVACVEMAAWRPCAAAVRAERVCIVCSTRFACRLCALAQSVGVPHCNALCTQRRMRFLKEGSTKSHHKYNIEERE